MDARAPRVCRVALARVLVGLVLVAGVLFAVPASAQAYSLTLTASSSTRVPVGTPVTLTVAVTGTIPEQTSVGVGLVDDPSNGGFPCGTNGCTGQVVFNSPGTLDYAGFVYGNTQWSGGTLNRSNVISVTWYDADQTPTGYSVTLAASASDVSVGTMVTLTATTNVDLTTTAYYATIFDDDTGTQLTTCGYGTTCAVEVTRDTPGTTTYLAYVGSAVGGDLQATSNAVSVTWTGAPVVLEHVDRVAGTSRYDTAATLATSRWSSGVGAVFVVTGANYPDALAAVPAAAMFGGPVLLTTRDELPSVTVAALQSLQPAQIVVVGGVGVVSDSVVAQLRSYTSGPVTRIAGANRYETAVLLSQFAFPVSPMPLGETSGIVYLASGEGFADALSGAALAAFYGGPLLLTTSASLPSVTAQEIARLTGLDQGLAFDPEQRGVIVFGGTGAVSDAVVQQLYALGVPEAGEGVLRMSGTTRYETSANIAGTLAAAIPGGEVVIATGANFPDGLVAGALGLPLLLVPPGELGYAAEGFFAIALPGSALVLGGTAAVSDPVAAAIDALLDGG